MLKRNGQVASRDDQLNLFDFARTREQTNLSDPIRPDGRAPLERVRPNMVRELEKKGTLMEALFEAQERTIAEMEALTRQLETEQKLTPQQAHDRAWEMIREKYILLAPEENL
jgi:hypothetical protein